MQTLRLVFLCQPLSSFSFFGFPVRFLALGGIQRCLLGSQRSANRRRLPVRSRPALPLDLGGRPAQARPDLVCLDLHDGALLAFLVLPRSHLQAPGHDDARATRQRPGLILVPTVDGHSELDDGRAVRRVAELWVVREVSHDDDLVLARHLRHLPFRDPLPGGSQCREGGSRLFAYAASPRTTTLNRNTSSASWSARSSSSIRAGSAVNSTTT